MASPHFPGCFEVENRGEVTVVNFMSRSIPDKHAFLLAGEQFFSQGEDIGGGELWLNFSNVEIITSQALGGLIALQKKVEKTGGRLILCNIPPLLEEIIQATRLDQILHIQNTNEKRSSKSPTRPSTAPREGSSGSQPGRSAPLDLPVVLCESRSTHARQLLQTLGLELEVVSLPDLGAVLEYCQDKIPAALVLALPWPGNPPGDNPGDLPILRFIQGFGRQAPIFLYAETNRLPLEIYCQVLAAGAKQVFNEESPTFAEDLRQVLTRLVRNLQSSHEEEEELFSLFAGFGLIGKHVAWRDVFRRALKASQFSDLPILILGETGTGKQRLAEAIQRLDPKRKDKPFLTLNCGALSKSLAESELFGHTKGAFSGAQSDRPGLFRMAEGGTLLLDEIGELDLELQPKLLRVLQEHLLLPIGADFEHSVDVRIMAATNRPLEQMIKEGKFREDLYQRLNVFRIHIPPLRERPDDIEVQARYFLKLHQIGRDQRVTDFGLRVLEALRLLPWEGNSRQLENLLREALAQKEHGTLLQMEDLPPWVFEKLAQLRPQAPEVDSRETLLQLAVEEKWPLNKAMEAFERRLLQVVLERNGGNRTLTASELGMTTRSIFNKIKKYRLD